MYSSFLFWVKGVGQIKFISVTVFQRTWVVVLCNPVIMGSGQKFDLRNDYMNLKTKVTLMGLGTVFLSFAIALFRFAGLGADPFTTLNVGISETTVLSFGITNVLVNAFLFLFVWKYKRELIGWGTVINMLTVGFIADFFFYTIENINGSVENIWIQILLTIGAVLLACLGIALYIESEFGVAPFDASSLVVVEISNGKIPFFVARMTIDGLSVAIGFMLGATVGVATLLMAFLAGGIIQFFREHVVHKMLILHRQPNNKRV